MLTLIITPRRGLYPSLACFEEDKICYDYRGRRDALNALNKQVVCFNWSVIDAVKIQVTQSFIRRRDVKDVLSKLRQTPYEIKHVGFEADPVNDLLTRYGTDVHPADIFEAIRQSRDQVND